MYDIVDTYSEFFGENGQGYRLIVSSNIQNSDAHRNPLRFREPVYISYCEILTGSHISPN